MARKFLTALDLAKNELQNPQIHNLAGAPGTPVKGQMYFNTTDSTLYWCENNVGPVWISARGGGTGFPGFGVSTATTTFGLAKTDGVAGTTARSDHHHGTPSLGGSATNMVINDTQSGGVAATASASDHKHGAPAFGASTAVLTFGAAKADGSAVTLARSDHTHGTPTHDNAAHSAITLNSLAQPTAQVNMGGQLLTNLAVPSGGTDATTKTYVDNLTAGMSWKNPVKVATTANITLSGLAAIDSVTPLAGDRVLVKNQTTTSANGIYSAASGAWSRASDANIESELVNAAVFVQQGTQADSAWVCTNDEVGFTLGTTPIAFVQFAGGGAVTAGSGLTQTGNTLNVGAGTGITVNADDVAINTSTIPTLAASNIFSTMQTLNGGLTVNGATALISSNEVTLASTVDPLRLGPATGANLAMDYSEIQARNNGAAAALELNPHGGSVNLGGNLNLPTGTILVSGVAQGIQVDNGAILTTASAVTVGAGAGSSFTSNALANTFAQQVSVTATPPSAAAHLTRKDYVDGLVTGTTKKYSVAIGGSTAQVITHNLNSQAVVCQVYRSATPWDEVECDIERTTVNTITLRFSAAPAASEYTAVVVG